MQIVRTGIPDALSGIRLLCVMGVNGDGCGDGGACPPLGEICEKTVKTGEMGTEVPDPFLQAKW